MNKYVFLQVIVLQNNDQEINNDQEVTSNINYTFYMDDDGLVHISELLLPLLDPNPLLTENLNPNNSNMDIQDENQSPNINVNNKRNTNQDLQQKVVENTENCNKIENVNPSNAAAQDGLKNVDPKVPSQFKDFIFWPKENISTKKRPAKVKLPSVLSSEEGLKWYSEQEEKKRKIEEEKELRKRMREAKKQTQKIKIEKKTY